MLIGTVERKLREMSTETRYALMGALFRFVNNPAPDEEEAPEPTTAEEIMQVLARFPWIKDVVIYDHREGNSYWLDVERVDYCASPGDGEFDCGEDHPPTIILHTYGDRAFNCD